MQKREITVWGDSIARGVVLDEQTQRYVRLEENSSVSLLAKAWRMPIENHARFGMTSTKQLIHMQRDLACSDGSRKEGIAAFEIGGNDVDYEWVQVAEDTQGEHIPHTPLPQFEENLVSLVQLARSHGLQPVFLTLPPIEPSRYFAWLSRSIAKKDNILRFLGDIFRLYRCHEMYSNTIVKKARELCCRCLDIREPFLRHPRYGDLLCADGIHPNAAGHRLIADTILSYGLETRL